MSKNFQYIKSNSQPSFIQKFKERAGIKAGPTLEDKLQKPDNDGKEEDYVEKDDEKPVVVVLKEGDLDEKEAEVEKEQQDIDDGKIVFRKPTKRKKENALSASSKKESKTEDKSKKKARKDDGKKTSKKASAVLLSFGDDEEE